MSSSAVPLPMQLWYLGAGPTSSPLSIIEASPA
jgi:hypothetical protein